MNLHFQYYYKRYVNRLFNYGMHSCKDRDLVKDCLQELFARLWAKRETLGVAGSVNFYLFKSFRRLLIRRLIANRKFSLPFQGEPSSVFEFIPSCEDSIIENEVKSQRMEMLKASMNALYKRRWDIETFFKLLKQNLNVKTFVGTSPNAVRSQIFVALITYLLLELLRRVKAKGKTAFSNFVEKIRICLCYYLTLDYVIQRIQPNARSIRVKQNTLCFEKHTPLFQTI